MYEKSLASSLSRKLLIFRALATSAVPAALVPWLSRGNSHPPSLVRRRYGTRAAFLESSVEQWLAAGAPAEKLVVGVPLYARTYTLADPDRHGVGAPALGPGAPGAVTQEPGYLTIYELCMNIEDEAWDLGEEKGIYFAYKGDQWATYEPLSEIRKKAEYVVKKGLAGVMVWPLESDDVSGICGQGSSPLLRELNKGLGRI